MIIKVAEKTNLYKTTGNTHGLHGMCIYAVVVLTQKPKQTVVKMNKEKLLSTLKEDRTLVPLIRSLDQC